MFCETRKAFAKVNFGLNVLPKREDGFHNLESIFQTIDLYDELIVTEAPAGNCTVRCDSMVLPEKNTLTLAYKAFCEIIPAKVPGVDVRLIKGIPSGGGLGGGSSDAAALVKVLEKQCGVKLSDELLDYIAAKTGSDVFFFMHCDEDGTGAALVSGRGEIIKKIKPRKDLFLLLIFPEVHSSTKEAYSLIDEAFAAGKKVEGPLFSDYEFVYNESISEWNFINTFTPVIADKYENVRNALGDIKKVGGCFAEMSGSGSTVFGVFTLKQQAMYVCDLLAGKWKCKLVRVL